MDLEQLRLKIIGDMRSLADKAEKEKRSLTEDEDKQYEDLRTQLAEVKKAITRAKELEDETRSIPQTKGIRPEANESRTQIEVGKTLIEDDPKRGFKTPREFITSVMSAGQGRKSDERLMSLRTAGSDEHSTFSDSYGGFLIPEGFSSTIMTTSPEADPIAGRVQRIPMSNPSVKIPARVDKDHSTSVSGGLTVTRRAESAAGTASRMQLEQVSLTAYSLFGVSYATEELLTDSPQSFAALIERGFQDEFGAHLVDERINGTGVGEFLGVLNAPCLVSVAKETSQTADTIVYENIVKMRSRVYGYGKAVWLANHDTMPQLMLMKQDIGTGGQSVYQPSAREDRPDLLLGRPIIYTEYMKTVGDKGDIICANWSEYLEGTLQPLQGAESIHVRFLEHERTFKFWLRNAGAPWWKSALTPKNSTATLSPFVALNAR